MKTYFTIFLLLVLPASSMAWGLLGHRVVGGIAETYLTAKAKSSIQSILGTESIAMASNWADFIKSDTSFNYLNTWHYINLPGGLSPFQFTDSLSRKSPVNLYTQMQFISAQLKNKNLPKEKKRFFLKLLIHLAGDVCQPMHVGRADDKGGNGIKLYWFGNPTNLHRVWDEQLIEFQQLSYSEHVKAINHSTPAQRAKWQKQPLSEWFRESYTIANSIYADVRAEDKLSYNYNYKWVAVMNEQLLKGGVRLAGLLNNIFAN